MDKFLTEKEIEELLSENQFLSQENALLRISVERKKERINELCDLLYQLNRKLSAQREKKHCKC